MNKNKLLLMLFVLLSAQQALNGMTITFPYKKKDGGLGFIDVKNDTTNRQYYDMIANNSGIDREKLAIFFRGEVIPDNDDPLDYEEMLNHAYAGIAIEKIIAPPMPPVEEAAPMSPLDAFILSLRSLSLEEQNTRLIEKLREKWV